jgi:hypothetical protein
MGLKSFNAAIYGRSVMAAFVRFFAQKVTAHGVPQDCLVMGFILYFGRINNPALAFPLNAMCHRYRRAHIFQALFQKD